METKLKNFPRIVFNEDINLPTELDYEIINLDEINLYGVGINTNNDKIGKDAPIFFRQTEDMIQNMKKVKSIIAYMIRKLKNLNILKYLKVSGLDLELIHRMLKIYKKYPINFMESSYHQLNIT